MERNLFKVREQNRPCSCVFCPWLHGRDSLPGHLWTEPGSSLEPAGWATKLGSEGGGQDKGLPALLSLFANVF